MKCLKELQNKTSLRRNATDRDIFGYFPKCLNGKYNELNQLNGDLGEDTFPQGRKIFFKEHYLL